MKLLADDPWRYLYALTQTAIEKSRALNGQGGELRICTTFAAFKVGRPLKVGEFVVGDEPVTEDFHESWRRGLRFTVVHKQWDSMPAHNRAYFKDVTRGPSWRDKDKIRPTADDMRRTLRRWREAAAANPNRRWLAGMVTIMRYCFDGLDKYAGVAEFIAGTIGERRYFAAKLRPVMATYAALRRAGVDDPALPPLSQMLDLIDPYFAPGPNYLPNDAA